MEKGLELLETQWEGLLRHYAELLAAYAAARLTGSHDVQELYDRHIRDCLASVPLLPASGKVIDVGSGGGLPGIVWAICRPDLEIVLLDSAKKKCLAMDEFASALGLKNVKPLWGRCEEHALKTRETYALASARALAHAGVLAEYLAPLVSVGGSLLAFKGPKGTEELAEVGGRWGELGLSDPSLLPYGPEDRNYAFVVWSKDKKCSRDYPRKAGLALTKPWWENRTGAAAKPASPNGKVSRAKNSKPSSGNRP